MEGHTGSMLKNKQNTNDKKDLVIFSNGPGEISTWVMPFVEAVRKKPEIAERYRILLVIHPCQFGSGTEHFVAERIDGVEAIIRPAEYLKLLISGFGRRRYGFKKSGIMFSLGGDLMHPVLFRKRIRGKHKLYAYSNNPGWEKYYEKIFVRNEYIRDKFLKGGASDEQLDITGDLVYSSLKFFGSRREIRKRLSLSDDDVMLVFLPGSRDFEVKYMLPVFLKVIDDITETMGGVKPFLLKSPYISYDTIRKALSYGGKIKEADSMSGTFHEREEKKEPYIRYSSGKEIQILEGGLEYWGRGMDFAVTLPGTNTIQLAYRKIPSLVVAALNKPEVIPIEGIFGLFKWVPILGKAVIRKAFFHYVKKFRYASLPNIYTNKEVIPELFGIIRTSDITERIKKILKSNEHLEIKERLTQFFLNNNPVDRIIREVWGS